MRAIRQISLLALGLMATCSVAMAKNAGDLLEQYVDNPKQAVKDEVLALMEIVSVDIDPTPEAKWKQTGTLHLKLIEAVGGELPPDIAVRFFKRHAEGDDAWTWDYVILVPGKRLLGFFNRWDGKWAVRLDGRANVINNPDKIAEDLIKKVQPLFKTSLLQVVAVHAADPKNPASDLIAWFGSERSPSAVRLFWSYKTWPEGADSVIVQRRVADDPDAKWTPLFKKAILPGWLNDDDLIYIESDPVERERLLKHRPHAFDHFVEKNREDIRKAVIEGAAKAHPSKWNKNERILISIAINFSIIKNGRLGYDFALLSGHACVDRSSDDKVAYDYGLFVINQQDKVADAPFELLRSPALATPDVTLHTLTAKVKKGEVWLDWTLSEDRWIDANGSVLGFNCIRERIDIKSDPVTLERDLFPQKSVPAPPGKCFFMALQQNLWVNFGSGRSPSV